MSIVYIWNKIPDNLKPKPSQIVNLVWLDYSGNNGMVRYKDKCLYSDVFIDGKVKTVAIPIDIGLLHDLLSKEIISKQ